MIIQSNCGQEYNWEKNSKRNAHWPLETVEKKPHLHTRLNILQYATKESSWSADKQCRRLRARQVQPQDGLCWLAKRGKEFAVQLDDGAERGGRKLPILHHRAQWSPLCCSWSPICKFFPFSTSCVGNFHVMDLSPVGRVFPIWVI